MEKPQNNWIKSSFVFIASLVIVAFISYSLAKFEFAGSFNLLDIEAFSLLVGLVAGLVLAYAIAFFVVKEKYRQRLLSDAVTDPESGLFTRHYMNEIAPRYVAMHQRNPKHNFAVSLVEIFHQEEILKQYGKKVLNAAYLSMATLIMESIRETDTAVAYGDYRVAVFATCDSEELAARIHHRIIEDLNNWKVSVKKGETISLSVVAAQVVHELDESLSDTLIRAEELLLQLSSIR